LQRTYEAMVDYNDLSPFERQVVRSAVPFYAFQKGVLKLVARVPADHPAATAALLTIAQLQQELNEDHYGGALPDYYRGLVDVPGVGPINTRGFNPFQDAAQLATPQGIAASMN